MKLCIFDLDGTLTDTLKSLHYSTNETLRHLGYPPITIEQCRKIVGSGARVQIERALTVAGDPQLRHIEEAMEIYRRVFSENCTYCVRPYRGMPETLTAMKDRGIRLAVCTNKPHAQAVEVTESVFGRETFDRILGQREGVPRKPDPAGVFEIMKEFSACREECLFVGDSEVDIETGKAAGVRCAGCCWGFRGRKILEKLNPGYLIEKPEELLGIL